ncbi:MAG TPA: HlyD family type I secretion periplasmic adaptor subunit [Albitalea sp.]|nr:HlyD family type I secretion periplasmic adaptor subunit [Albitalea sp.]
MSALAEVLMHASPDSGQRREWQRQVRSLLLPVAVAAGLLAAWTAAAPLAGAVVAPAQLKVEYKRKTVQHQEGGIVREILVHDGQQVRAGDPLLVVGDLRQEAELKLLQDQWRAARARVARAEAESRLAARFDAPDELQRDSAAADHIARERAVFASRRAALDEQGALLQAQVLQAQAQAAALESQIDATKVSGKLSEEELAMNEDLARQGFVNRTRLIGLQRIAADYKSRLGEVGGELAAARQRVAELRARGAQLRLSYQTQATDELKDAASRVRELEERLRPSQDQVERQVVRAPVDGDVMSLHVAGPGAVIAPREPLLDVVPRHEKLVVDARIEPQDIEHVHVGGAAEVRLLSADARRTPLLPAKVTFVSADRVTQGETGKAWFDVTVEVDARALEQLPAVRLQAGMPAELYVTTGDRTLLEYLTKPLRTFSQRALREPG